VSDQQSVAHRLRGDAERLDHERPQEHGQRERPEGRLDVFPNDGTRLRAGAGTAAATQALTHGFGCLISWTLPLHLENRQEGFLGILDGSDLLHTALSFLLFLEQLALAGDVAAVALRGDVLAHGAERLARNHLAAERGLDRHLEHLPRDELLELRA